MPQPVSNTLTVVSGSLLANKISYVVDGQNRNYRGGYGGLSWMSEAEATNNVIFIGNTSTIGRGPADKPLFYPSFNTSDANIIYAANTLPGSPRNFTTVAGAYGWAANNNFFINSANSPIPRIDADGLALYLDASQPTSYPQTNNDWFDLSGFGNNGTLINGTSWNSKGYFDFDGVDDYVNSPLVKTQACTFIGIASTTTLSSNPMLFNAGPYGSGPDLFFYNNLISWNTWDGDGNALTSIPSSVTNGAFHHYVLVNDPVANNARLYYDSNLIGTAGYRTAANNTNLTIGGPTQDYMWNGRISSFNVYNKTLSLAEIKQNYFQGNIVTSSLSYLWDANNLVSYGKSGTNVYNLTGSISGSLTNGTGYTYNNGGCWVFDGVDDYILLENSLISITPGNGDWTLSAWVKGPWSSAVNYPIVGNTSGGPVASGFGIYQNKIFYQNYDGNWQTHYGNTTLNPNTWYHLTWVNYAGASAALGTMKMYVNAVADSSTFNSYTTNGGPVNAIGSAYYGIYSGNIASVQWNIGTAFSDQQVAQQYEATKYKFQGPQIVTSGLVLNLDSANKDSYPGTGTTWTDLSGNGYNNTLNNGVAFMSNVNGGVLSFDGTDDFGIGSISSTIFSGAHSIGCWFYRRSVTDWAGLFSNNVGTTSCSILTFISSGNSIGTNQVGINGTSIAVDLGADHLNKWIYCVIVYTGATNGSQVNVYAYEDGNLLTATGNLYWDLSTHNQYYVGRHWTGATQILNGNIPVVQVYNRALSATEVAQNYNAQKTRFGL